MVHRYLCAVAVALSILVGCAAPAPPEMYAVRAPAVPSQIELKSNIYASLSSGLGEESRVNFLAGTYGLASENEKGQFYAGDLPSLWRDVSGQVVLHRGGVWIPKKAGQPLAVFFYRGQPIVAKTLAAAIERRDNPISQGNKPLDGGESVSKAAFQVAPAGVSPLQGGVGAAVAGGIIYAVLANSGDEQIFGVPRNKEFAETLRASFVAR